MTGSVAVGALEVTEAAEVDEPVTAVTVLGGDLQGQVARGFAWSMVAAVTMQISRVAFGVVLARLLTPHEYGLAAMALIFSSLVLAFSDLSLSAGLVQRQEITEDDRSTVFWTSCGVGLLLTLAGIAVAGPVAQFYGQPAVKPLLMALSASFFITALQPTQSALLQREMNFRALSVRLMVATILSGAVGVAMAASGFGAWALIAQQITLASVSSALLWKLSDWRPRFLFSFDSLRDLGSFGLKLLGSRLLSYLKGNSDNILVGRFLGSAPLGAYSVAYNIMMLPVVRLILPVQETLYPALSRLQDDRERLASVWIRSSRMVAAVVVPGMLLVIITAPDLVHVMLGGKWHRVAPLLQFLAVVAMSYSLSAVATKVLTALDRTRTLLIFSIVDYATALAAFALGLHWGIYGLAICYAIVSVPVQAILIGLASSALGGMAGAFVRGLSGLTAASVAMAVAALLLRLALVGAHIPAVLRLLAVIPAAGVVFVPLCFWLAPAISEDAKPLLARLRRTATTPRETPPETARGLPLGARLEGSSRARRTG